MTFAALWPTRAHAVASGVIANNLSPTDTGIMATPLNTGPTMTLRTDGYGALSIYVALTRSATTQINVTCTAGPTPLVQGPVGVATVNSTTGAIGIVGSVFNYPVSTSGTYRIMLAPLNDLFVTCAFTGTGANSSDIIAVYARMGGVP